MIHAGKFKDTYFVLDVESGALHCVDPLAYEMAALMEQGVQDHDALVSHLSGRFPAQQIEETYTEICEMVSDGLWMSPAVLTPDNPPVYQPQIKSLCLHIAHDCNLRCTYCFADEGAYHGDRSRMTKEVARAALDFLMERSGSRKHLEVDFFGGEPLINFEVVKDAVAYGRELEKKFDKVIRFTLTTNAYHVTDEMVDFINAEMKNLVISLDGRQEVHDAVRKTVAGTGSWETCVKNAKRLLASRGDKEHYVRGTFTAGNLDFSKDVETLVDLGFDQLSLEPVVTEGDLALTEEHLPTLTAEYERLGEILEKRRADGKPFYFFHFMVDFTGGPCLHKRLRGCGAGLEYAAVTPQGDLYPCHQFVNFPEFKMGNVLDGSFDPSVGEPFAHCHVLAKPVCQNCWAKYICSGGCAASAYSSNGDMCKPHELSCKLQKARLDTAIGLYVRKLLTDANT